MLNVIMFAVVNSKSSLSAVNMDWILLILTYRIPFFSIHEDVAKIRIEEQHNRDAVVADHLIKYCK